MKTKDEIDKEIQLLWNEAEAISDLLMEQVIRDDKLIEELQQRQVACRNQSLALMWVEDEK